MPKFFTFFLRVFRLLKSLFFSVLLAYNCYLYNFQIRLNKETFMQFLDYVVPFTCNQVVLFIIKVKTTFFSIIRFFVLSNHDFTEFFAKRLEIFGKKIGYDLTYLSYNLMYYQITFVLFIEYFCIIYVILYVLALSIWTRAAGPRIRLDQIIIHLFRYAVPILMLIIIIIILSSSSG